jgi:hypothetical protein
MIRALKAVVGATFVTVLVGTLLLIAAVAAGLILRVLAEALAVGWNLL